MSLRLTPTFPLFLLALSLVPARGAEAAPAPAQAKSPGHPALRASTGHLSNYDEEKVGTYQLPPLLALASGRLVKDAATWNRERRPEILRLYETEIYGRVPASAPAARAEVLDAGTLVENGAARRKHVVVHFGPGENGPKADVVMYVPVGVSAPPVLLQLVFFRGLSGDGAEPPRAAAKAGAAPQTSEPGPVDEFLRRGYAYATFRYTDVQPDKKDTNSSGVEALAYAPGQTQPAPDEWGTISAWAWAASRVLDYLQTDHDVDARRVALIGHSRLGKTVLWASAMDPRFAMVFSSCSGEMGAALARRDYGETVDDMVDRFPYQFAGNLKKYAGHWNDMPVDSHMLIALSAPRPVFITGGTDDQWADPKGEFLAEVAASPVYELLGRKGLGTTVLPPLDHALIEGELGWRFHTGGHAILPGDWTAFLDFADRHLK